MKKIALQAVAMAIGTAALCANAGIASAHHSFAMFDRTKSATVSGTVRTFEFTNPHVYLWLYSTNASGAQDLYAVEFSGGTAALNHAGWTKQTLKPGDKVTVNYNPLRDGRNGGRFVE